MALTLAQLAQQLDVELVGDGDACVSTVASLQRAGPGALSFLANPKYRRHLKTTRASAVVLSGRDARDSPVPVLLSDNPYACYARAARLLYPQETSRCGIHPSAVVDNTAEVDPGAWIGAHAVIEQHAKIGPSVQIGPGCVVGAGVEIGEGSHLVARVTVLAKAHIGRHTTLHPGVVIGSDGFGQAEVEGHWEKVPQLGSVVIGDDVEIGANTTVDRGSLDDTVIEEGVKIDNQVQVAHNVVIGAHTAIAGCVGISGSALAVQSLLTKDGYLYAGASDSWGAVRAQKPSSPSFFTVSAGNSSSRSHWAAWGAISSRRFRPGSGIGPAGWRSRRYSPAESSRRSRARPWRRRPRSAVRCRSTRAGRS